MSREVLSQKSNIAASSTGYNLLHPRQLPLSLEGVERMVVVVSGDFGVGKTSLNCGILQGTASLPAHNKAIVSNDLMGSDTTVDADRYARIKGVEHRTIEACACCDAQAEFTTSVEQLLRDPSKRLLVVETGGQTNGSQAVEALKRVLRTTSAELPRVVHVTVIDAERFPHRERNGELTISELNLETADVILVSKASDNELAKKVSSFIERMLSDAPPELRPSIHYSQQPYLISHELWKDISKTTLPDQRRRMLSDEKRAELHIKRRALVSDCVPVKVSLYTHHLEAVNKAISTAVASGQPVEKVLVSSIGALFKEVHLKVEEVAHANSVEPASLIRSIIRVKGEIPVPQLNKQYGVDIYLSADGGKPDVKVKEFSGITSKAPYVCVYTNTREPMPHWLSGIGIPVEFTAGAHEECRKALIAAKSQALNRLKLTTPIPLRAEAERTYELLERSYIDSIHSESRGVESPYLQMVQELRSGKSVQAKELVGEVLRSAFFAFLDSRVSLLEAVKKGKRNNSLKLSSHLGSTIFAFCCDLMIAHQTHKGGLLSDENLKRDRDLGALWERAKKLSFGTMAVAEGLLLSDAVKVRGISELNSDTTKFIVWSVWYGSQENKGDQSRAAWYREMVPKAISNAEKVAAVRKYAGWNAASVSRLKELCAKNMG